MTSKLIIEFNDKATMKEFMKWFEEDGHIRYHGDMDFSDVNSNNVVEDFYYDYKKGIIETN